MLNVYAKGSFWSATVERVIKTVSQTALGLITSNVVGITDVDWSQVASVSALAGIASVLTSLASANVGGEGPSLGREVVVDK